MLKPVYWRWLGLLANFTLSSGANTHIMNLCFESFESHMIRSVLHYLLVAEVLGCPFWCQAGVCNAGDACHTQCFNSRCAACTHCPQKERRGSVPRGSSPCDQRQQCFCAGAIIIKDDIRLTQKFEYSLESVAATLTRPAEISGRSDGSRRTLTDDTRSTPGRVLRCLHMSFLC